VADPADPPRLAVQPGGAIDVLNRVIAEKLGPRLGQQVIVDAVPGANTIVGADVVAKARARRLHLHDHDDVDAR
jgi:tripartite-type tricarboxylate transporter receptor subunit TctC